MIIRRRSDNIISQQRVQTNPRNSHGLLHRHTIYAAKFEGKKKQHAWIHGFTDNKLLSVKPCRPMLLFIQTLPRILCAGAISRVSFYRICLDRLLGLCNHFSGELSFSYVAERRAVNGVKRHNNTAKKIVKFTIKYGHPVCPPTTLKSTIIPLTFYSLSLSN